MSEVVAIVEGQTEQTFIRDHLAAHLGARGIAISARLPGRVVRRGGVRAWQSVRGDILRTLKERRGRICTTMFDFYAMPRDWPGREQASHEGFEHRGTRIERAMLDDLASHAGEDFRRELFIPYVQVHEFEALLFGDVAKMADVLSHVSKLDASSLSNRLGSIVESAGQAEAINDGHDTCPSRRISSIVPAYRKPLYGPIIAARIGLQVLKQACPHFGQWVERLESLAEPNIQ